MDDQQPIAGPSRPVKPLRKPRAPNSSVPSSSRQKYPPSLPAKTASSHPTTRPNGFLPTQPNKVLQGQSTRRIDASRNDFGRDVIFVTRKISLGALMGRCRKLVVEEGYTRLTLYAINAAIPHALLLLHALIDLLPYPKGPKGMWHEIHTGTAECVDEVDVGTGGENEFSGVGAVEESEPERRTRLSSTIRIDLHVTPKSPARVEKSKRLGAPKKPNRKSKRQRMTLLRQRKADGKAALEEGTGVDELDDEEADMNAAYGGGGSMGDDFEEEVEEVEER